MPTLLTAGDATNGVVLTSASDNALTIQTGAAGAKVNAAAFASDGTLTLVKPMAGGSLTLGTAQNTTSGTNIDFTGIPSWVKRVTVMFNGVSTNGANNYLLQLGSGSVQSSGYLSSSSFMSTGVSTAAFTNGFGLSNASAGTATVFQGSISLILLSGSSWVASGVLGQSDTARTWLIGGSVTLSGALDRLRLTTVGGTDTFDAGSINILYEG